MIRTEIQELLDMFAAMPLADFPDLGAEQARAVFAELRVAPENLPAVHEVETTSIPGLGGDLPVRIYRPGPEPNLPVLVWFHGGGWVLGDLETGDLPCQTLARRAHCVVVAVDYRLAPEHPFPAAYDDCLAALTWVREQAEPLGVDRSRVAVGGDSAGGNLAAAVALEAVARGWELSHQLLVYPVIAPDFTTDSYTDNGDGYFLTRRGMQWFWDQYTDPDQRDDIRVNPLAADPERLAGLPPTWVFTAEYDPLRDEGRRYATAMQEAGVVVEQVHATDMIHGVFGMTLEAGEEVRAQAADALRAAFAAPVS